MVYRGSLVGAADERVSAGAGVVGGLRRGNHAARAGHVLLGSGVEGGGGERGKKGVDGGRPTFESKLVAAVSLHPPYWHISGTEWPASTYPTDTKLSAAGSVQP